MVTGSHPRFTVDGLDHTTASRSVIRRKTAKSTSPSQGPKGASRWRIVWHHLLPNTRGTLITVVMLSYVSLLEGAVLTESVFAWPGLGRYLTNALFASDMPAILGATLVIGSCFIIINALTDALVWLTDPRTR